MFILIKNKDVSCTEIMAKEFDCFREHLQAAYSQQKWKLCCVNLKHKNYNYNRGKINIR